MRGHHALFSNLIEVPNAAQKGRDAVLHAQRNERLCARYYFYLNYSALRYVAIIEQLTLEFDLSARRIADLLQAHIAIIQQLKRDAPAVPWFRQRWPHIVWTATK